jgi:hypothetical protein
LQYPGVSRSTGFRRRRGGVVLALGLLTSGAVHAMAGCGEQLGLAENGGPPTAPDAASADGSTQGGPDGAVEKDGATDSAEQGPRCDGPLKFDTPVLLPYTVIPATSRVIHPFVSADEKILFGESVVGGNHNLVYGTRVTPTDPFDLVVINAGAALPDQDELAPAGFTENEIYFGHPTQKSLFVTRRTAPGSEWYSNPVSGIPIGGDEDRWPSLTADGLLMVFRRTEQNAEGLAHNLKQITRTATDGPWSLVTIGVMTADMSHPVITHDGLGLFYKQGGQTLFASRTTTTHSFQLASGTPVSIGGMETSLVIVRSMSRDGCRLYLTNGNDSYVATRAN